MSRKWVLTCFAAGVLILLTGLSARAAEDSLPLWRLFQQPDPCPPYDGKYDPPKGYFFNVHALYWWITPPELTTIGREGLARQVFYTPEIVDPVTLEVIYPAITDIQTNALDTGWLHPEGTTGTRWEFGNVGREHGWLVSIFDMHTDTQEAWFGTSDMTFEDPTGYLNGQLALYLTNNLYIVPGIVGPLPVTFDDVYAFNSTETWSTEAMYVRRFCPTHGNATFEMFLGCRYMEFNDRFFVDARGDIPATGEDDDEDFADPRFRYNEDGQPDGPGVVLADSHWLTDANNRIVGPQIGLRFWKRYNRVAVTSEARFFAGFNFQSIDQQGTFATEADEPVPYDFTPGTPDQPWVLLTRRPSSFHNTDHFEEFSPGVELRLSAEVYLTEAITLTAGWTGLWMDGIARSSNMIYYSVPQMGILPENNRQDVFMNGLHIGLQVNR